MARYGQITEVGYGGGQGQVGAWETDQGSAAAWAGSDDENSPGAGVMYPGRTAPKAQRPGWAPETGGPFDPPGPDYGGAQGEIVELDIDQTGPGGTDFVMDTMAADPGSMTAADEYPLTEQQAESIREVAARAASEPCGLTIAEFEAHKAQMMADADHQRRQKTIHLALAAAAGFILARYILR